MVQISLWPKLHVSGGDLHLDNNEQITYRNAANTGSRNMIRSDASDNVVIAGTNTNNVNIKVSGASNALYVESGGNVGIGSNNPTEELDVEGDIIIDNDYKYESAKTHYISVPAAAFTGPATSQTNGSVSSDWPKTSGEAVGRSRWMGDGTGSQENVMVAPVYFPDGAVVTEVKFYVVDQDNAKQVYGRLSRRAHTELSAVTNMATTPVTGTTSTSSAMRTLTDNTISSATIDNSGYTYWLKFHTYEKNYNLRIYGARIKYTVLKAD